MLDQETKKRIFDARDVLVGKIPDPKAQVEQITTALIYKFMADMDFESEDLGGEPQFFTGEYEKYAWKNLVDTRLSGEDRFNLYVEALDQMPLNKNLPQLFRDMLKNAFVPYKDPETLRLFLKKINEFTYDHSEKLGDAFEYLLSVLGSQGDAGQFRTPRHIIDFIVDVLDPQKGETIFDPACGTGGFLISSYKHILRQNMVDVPGDLLTPDEKTKLMSNFIGYDISPDMVRLCLVNMYLHNFPNPTTYEYDTLTSEERWDEMGDLVMANPPFMSPTGGIRPHKRFSIQAKRSEILFVDYIAEHLNVHGRAGIIVPEGVIFQSGTAYKALRKMLVEKYLYAVVSLPAGVFNPYSGVKTSILLMDKQLSKMTKTILFVKIENDGFDLGAQRKAINKNDLPPAADVLKYYRQGLLRGEDVRAISEDVLKQGNKIIMVEKAVLAKKGDYDLAGDRHKKVRIRKNQNWPVVELENVARLINGRAYKQEELLDNGKIPVLRVGNFFSNRGWYYSNLELEDNKYCDKGDLLFAWSASFGPKIWDGPRAIFHYHIWKIEVSNAIDKMFLYYLLKLETENIKSQGHGIAMTHVTKERMEKTKIPLPPLEVQREIVTELDNYQKIIDGARQVITNYKPQIKFDPSWEVRSLQEVCDKITDGTHQTPTYAESGTIFLSSKNVTSKKIDWENIKYIPDELHQELSKRISPKIGDVLLAKSGTLGIAALVDRDVVFDIYESLALFRTKDILIPQLLTYFLNSSFVENEFLSRTKGIGIKHLHLDELKQISIPIPPMDVQKQIVQQLEREQKLVDTNRELIEIFEQKINDKIADIWGSGDAAVEAEAESMNNYIAASEEDLVVPRIAQASLFTV